METLQDLEARTHGLLSGRPKLGVGPCSWRHRLDKLRRHLIDARQTEQGHVKRPVDSLVFGLLHDLAPQVGHAGAHFPDSAITPFSASPSSSSNYFFVSFSDMFLSLYEKRPPASASSWAKCAELREVLNLPCDERTVPTACPVAAGDPHLLLAGTDISRLTLAAATRLGTG